MRYPDCLGFGSQNRLPKLDVDGLKACGNSWNYTSLIADLSHFKRRQAKLEMLEFAGLLGGLALASRS